MKLTPSLLEICTNAYKVGDFSTCKPLGFDLLGWIAILTFAAGIGLWLAKTARQPAVAKPTVEIPWRPWRTRFRALCIMIEPLMNENGRLFHEFGPNSGRGDSLPKTVRFDLSVWKQLVPKVVTNNARIRELIATNFAIIPTQYAWIFDKWINHIDAFEAHSSDDLVDYRDNQFPLEIFDVIRQNS